MWTEKEPLANAFFISSLRRVSIGENRSGNLADISMKRWFRVFTSMVNVSPPMAKSPLPQPVIDLTMRPTPPLKLFQKPGGLKTLCRRLVKLFRAQCSCSHLAYDNPGGKVCEHGRLPEARPGGKRERQSPYDGISRAAYIEDLFGDRGYMGLGGRLKKAHAVLAPRNQERLAP